MKKLKIILFVIATLFAVFAIDNLVPDSDGYIYPYTFPSDIFYLIFYVLLVLYIVLKKLKAKIFR